MPNLPYTETQCTKGIKYTKGRHDSRERCIAFFKTELHLLKICANFTCENNELNSTAGSQKAHPQLFKIFISLFSFLLDCKTLFCSFLQKFKFIFQFL